MPCWLSFFLPIINVNIVVVCLFTYTPPIPGPGVDWDLEYSTLERTVEDRVGLAAIRALHQQLDDDHDGTIEPSETGDFIKADLKVSGGMRTDLPDSSLSALY